ncbi:PKD domain-containing protein [Thalassomonas haliotis]|uniref:PKD domain-containing protein n=1 Tax=Thalassomonas haliotis TaxID=485448 RepID=A0ABY7VI29_9GAMM|nr:PKD domain-containing protein [Thalassomonas haliotis]WDE13155.1 PKD domain-containing protein [Thalassomonas haliotis]
MNKIVFAFASAVLLLTACGGGGGSDKPVITNHTPVAQISHNITDINAVPLGQSLNFSGVQSSDSDGDSLSYRWSLSDEDGESLVLAGADQAEVDFIPVQAGEFSLSLVVNDGQKDSNAKNIHFTVVGDTATPDQAPVADAGRDQNVLLNASVQLDGSQSLDPDGAAISYLWQFIEKPQGSAASFDDDTLAQPRFTADVLGNYRLSLEVNDGALTSEADEVVIHVAASEENSRPVANAGENQHVLVTGIVILDGSLSSDANNDQLTYRWQMTAKPEGSSAVLVSETGVQTRFTADAEGIFVFSLEVSDGALTSEADQVVITVSSENMAPVADAGADQAVGVNESVSLDASGSSDPEGGQLQYDWDFISKPEGSDSAFDNDNLVNASFVPDLAGEYVLSLKVFDGYTLSEADNVVIIASQQSSLLNGMVYGKLVNSLNVSLAGLSVQVNDIELTTSNQGEFSTEIQVAENETITITVSDDTIPTAVYTSGSIVKSNGPGNYDFTLLLPVQQLPVMQTVTGLFFDCNDYLGQGPDSLEVNFALVEDESTLFAINYEQVYPMEVGENFSISLPAYGKFDVSTEGFWLSTINEPEYGAVTRLTNLYTGDTGITSLNVCLAE